MAWDNRMFKLITPFLEELQDIEYVLSDLRLFRSIDSGVGAQLDGIGDILNVARRTMTDIEYRVQLRLKIFLNTSSGQPEVIIAFIKNLSESTTVKLYEAYPARVILEIDNIPTTITLKEMLQLTQQLAPVGVTIEIKYINPASPAFAFDDEGLEVTDGEGFYETGYGGVQVAGVISEQV